MILLNGKITLKGVVDEDFVNYKVPSMFIATNECTFKCDHEAGERICQNSSLSHMKARSIPIDDLVDRYMKNDITKAVVFGGLEPFDQYIDVFDALLQEESGTIRICATPDLSSFMKIYSPRFEVMYERPVNADASVYKGDIRAVYDQMSTSTPDVAMVVKLLGNNGYDHILYDRNDTYWNLPLEEFGYELILQVGDYSIYRYARTEQTE